MYVKPFSWSICNVWFLFEINAKAYSQVVQCTPRAVKKFFSGVIYREYV